MDFMKVLDQTVRDIKREVNLKVLKVPELEQKVLDATSDEPWGPHGSDLAEIARATYKYSECQMVMNVLLERLRNTNADWRYVYKALVVIDYLLANGSSHAIDEIFGNYSQISMLSRFKYVEPSGKDCGINVRKRTETILSILDDKEKLQALRDKAAASRDKYVGLSSSGISYKSSSAFLGSDSSSSSSRYGSVSGSKEASSYRVSDIETEPDYKEQGSTRSKISQRSAETSYARKKDPSNRPTSSNASSGTKTKSHSVSDADDFDDFNPRGSVQGPSQVNLNGHSLIDDLIDISSPTAAAGTTPNVPTNPDVDLFADASFQSAASHAEPAPFQAKGFAASFPSTTESPAHFPSTTESPAQEKSSLSENTTTQTFDPFSAIPLSNFDGSDPFGDFSSNVAASTAETSRNSIGSKPSEDLTFGEFASHATASATSATAQSETKLSSNVEHMASSKPATGKGAFHVKSGIWADSLSRGLIDLNITAPKKVNLADVGVVGGLDEAYDQKAPAAPGYQHALGMGGLSSSSAFGGTVHSFPPLSQQQPGRFK